MTTNQTSEIIFTARAKAFSRQGVRNHKFLLSQDGTIRVWDAIAGHYTTCHSLSTSAQARLRKIAKVSIA